MFIVLFLLFNEMLAASPELKLKNLQFSTQSYELSGLAIVEGKLIGISDEPEHVDLLQVKPSSKRRFHFVPYRFLKQLAGFPAYLAGAEPILKQQQIDKAWDLEGIAACGKTIYLANERIREVVEISDKDLRKIPLDFSEYKDLWLGGKNAGLEGIATDCDRKLLYVAKERHPRMLFEFAIGGGKAIKRGDITASDRAGQKVINFETGTGLMEIDTDFADLWYAKDHLYVLERNTREIAKVKTKDFSVVARWSYLNTEIGLYDTPEPFGQAEALVLKDNEIILGFDNNQRPLSHATGKKYDVKGPFSTIAIFERPEGF